MPIGPWVARIVDLAIGVLAPPRCSACDASVGLLAAFCPDCARQIETGAPGDDVLAGFVYGGPIARAIALLKYEGRADLARPLGDLLWRTVEPHARDLQDAIVVPVPLHPRRLSERGYNQAALLGQRVAHHLGVRLDARVLARVRDTPHQVNLSAVDRHTNVSQAFRARRSKKHLIDTHALLVDDVLTTGATLRACALALEEAGVSRITRAVLAFSPSAAHLGPAGVS